jgi:hypothetical protein
LKKIILILLFFVFELRSQNLVSNWSFETYTACPNATGQLPNATFWYCASSCGEYWNVCGTPPYNVPSSLAFYYQFPKDGNAFISLQTWSGNYREYAQTKLIDTLKNGLCYYVEFYVNVPNGCKNGINNISANLSQIAYSSSTPLNIPSQITRYGNPIIKDTMNWVQIAGIYQASGGETYLTIGNMQNDASTLTGTIQPTGASGGVQLFDAVSVYSINPTGPLPWSYRDTTVNYGDSVYIGNYLGGSLNQSWSLLGGGFVGNGAGVYVKPTITSNYVVSFTLCGVVRTDTLKVTVNGGVGISESEKRNAEFIISPNPNNGLINLEILNDQFANDASTTLSTEIRIMNIVGKEMKKEKIKNKKQEIDLRELESGIYYLRIEKDNKIVVVKKIIKQ